MIKEGDKAPDFSLGDEQGKTISLSSFLNRKVVLYFYPKDDTPGCTEEACSFRDAYDEIGERGAVVIGISADLAGSHESFKKKYRLPFYLLSDPDRKTITAYGAWGKKKMFGKEYDGIIRMTFIIDEKGKVMKIFPKVTPKEHAREVLGYL